MLRAFLLTIGLLLSPMVAHAQRCAEPLQTGAGVSSTALNPVTVHVLGATIVPVPATDGLVHLAYAAQVTNLANEPATVEAIEPVNALRDFAPTGRNEVLAPGQHPASRALPASPAGPYLSGLRTPATGLRTLTLRSVRGRCQARSALWGRRTNHAERPWQEAPVAGAS